MAWCIISCTYVRTVLKMMSACACARGCACACVCEESVSDLDCMHVVRLFACMRVVCCRVFAVRVLCVCVCVYHLLPVSEIAHTFLVDSAF